MVALEEIAPFRRLKGKDTEVYAAEVQEEENA